MYPLRRNRRLRTNESIRSLVRETIISPNDFLVPLFVVEGKGIKEEIASMPNYFRYSLDLLENEVKALWKLGLKSVLLFVKVPDSLKDNKGTEALNPNGLMQRAIKTVKNACPDMLVMTDVALDPYSMYGHDGIIENGKIVNDDTAEFLAEIKDCDNTAPIQDNDVQYLSQLIYTMQQRTGTAQKIEFVLFDTFGNSKTFNDKVKLMNYIKGNPDSEFEVMVYTSNVVLSTHAVMQKSE